jgi:hypothetical protein
MNCVFTGRQFQAFLSDPHFWGQGQSYENLRLLVNGTPYGQAEFEGDWDPQDLEPDDFVQILDGVWHGHGFFLPNHQMASVIEFWQAGQKPEKIVKPIEQSAQSTIARVIAKPYIRHEAKIEQEASVPRPMFKI